MYYLILKLLLYQQNLKYLLDLKFHPHLMNLKNQKCYLSLMLLHYLLNH
jgi:hypothetical protein